MTEQLYWNQIMYTFGNYYELNIESIIPAIHKKIWKEKEDKRFGFSELPLE